MEVTSFNPDRNIPNLSGKVIFITGGTAGLGRLSILNLSKHHPKHIFFSGRNPESAAAVISDVKTVVSDVDVTFIPCDLASLGSVQEAARQFLSKSQRLDVLICNAGVMGVPPALTKDGYEVQFGTNHLGHALLIKLLMPTLERSAQEPASDARVVIITSEAFIMHPSEGIVFKDLRTVQTFVLGGGWRRYGQSKLANMLYAAELARRYPSITTVSVHPGVIATGLVTGLSLVNQVSLRLLYIGRMVTIEEGVKNQLWAATTERKNLVNGTYYAPVGVPGKHYRMSKDVNLARELWEWTHKALGAYEAGV